MHTCLHFGFVFERDCLFPIGLLELESVSTFGLFVGLVSLGWVGPCFCITLSESMGGLMGWRRVVLDESTYLMRIITV